MIYKKYQKQTSEQINIVENSGLRSGQTPADDFVISSNSDGTPLSRYNDVVWDMTPYSANGRRNVLGFKYWKQGELTLQRKELENEIRWFLFALLFIRQGPMISNATLKQYNYFFYEVARFCEQLDITMKRFFSDNDLFYDCLKDLPLRIHFGCSYIGVLENIGKDVLGFSPVHPSVTNKLRKRKKELISSHKQYSPIPTRIYSLILSQLSTELRDFEIVEKDVLSIYSDLIADPFYGRDEASQYRIAKKLNCKLGKVRPDFRSVLQQHNLTEYWKNKELFNSAAGLTRLFIEIMLVASLQIQAFTGMRAGEVEMLPYDCIEENQNTIDKKLHYMIKGYTTKKSHGKKKPAKWVTCETAIIAIRLAQKISRALYQSKGLDPEGPSANVGSFYLFISPDFARVENAPPYLMLCTFESLRGRLEPEIQELDLQELEEIDPHRAWRSEPEFEIGKPWALSTHQLRRSLALYAHRSGMVSLPSLKRQLQHITMEMASYYSRGSSYAKSLVSEDDKEHFIYEWQDAEPISQYLGYVLNVLLTDQPLFGPHITRVNDQFRDVDGVVVVDKDALLSSFKKGGIAYTETILGGCVKVGPCNKNPLDILHLDCLTTKCQNLIGSKEKLERVIKAETNLVNKLKAVDPESSIFRHELSNLKVLEETLNNINQEKIGE